MIEMKLLEDAFREFSKASNSIINYYNTLQDQIKELKNEVERKNKELEQATEYLHFILDSLPVGVVVLDRGTVSFFNKKAEESGPEIFLEALQKDGGKTGEIKNDMGFFRWKKEALKDGFEGKAVVVFEDVTEFERMKERLERDERLKAMGEMAARIAHEIKTPLASMELFLSMLLDSKLKVKERRYIDYVHFGVKTIDRIINNMLSYTKPRALCLKEGDIVELIQNIIDFMGVSIMARAITIDFNPIDNGHSIFDPDLMKLVFMNFISNAIEAIDRGGSITIKTGSEGDFVVIIIKDTGRGMNEEVKRHLFDPFFTTKDKGLGLGLFIAYNIIKAHGGYIEVDSTEGMGSTFFIYMPKGGK